MKKFFILFFLSLITLKSIPSPPPHEGLWLPLFIKDYNYNEMRRAGLKLSADQLYNINKPCIKDAVVAIGDGNGSGTIISNKGLLLTTYQSAYPFISKLSSKETNFIKNGFWASSQKEEIPCLGLEVTFLIEMQDVTEDVLFAIPENISESKREELIQRKIDKILAKYNKEERYQAKIESFSYGNQYFLFVYQTFQDIRIVGAPPSEIAQFGGETERWSWPRHNADFAIFRIYSSPDGAPSKFDPENIPFVPKYYIPISLKGFRMEDFAMVWGYPQASKRSISSQEVKYWTDIYAKAYVEASAPFLSPFRNSINSSDSSKLYYGDFFNVLTNQYIRSKGEIDNIFALDISTEIQNRERKMQKWITSETQSNKKFHSLFLNMDSIYSKVDPNLIKCFWYGNITLQSSKFLMIPYLIQEFSPSTKTTIEIENIVNQYNKIILTVDKDLEIKLIEASFSLWEKLPESVRPKMSAFITKYFGNSSKLFATNVVNKSIFSSEERLRKFLAHPKMAIYQKDPLVRYYQELIKIIELGNRELLKFETAMIPLRRDYASILLQMDHSYEIKFYPEANNSMRVSFGNIVGYQPSDAISFNYFTNHLGILSKVKGKPNDVNYKIPEKLKSLLIEQDFLSYEQDGELRICFITNADSGYGSVGSPVLNGDGQLIGIMFDANRESIGNNFLYNKEIHRTVCLDTRYILFLIDKFADASYLFQEMNIIQ